MIRAATNLFVGREPDRNPPVRNLGVRQQILTGGHNFRNARLVVRAEQRCPVGHNQMLPLVAGEKREGRKRDHFPVAKFHIAAVILHHARANVLPRRVGRGVHVRNEAEDRHVLHSLRCGKPAHDIPVFVHRSVTKPQTLHLFNQMCAENLLPRRARNRLRVLVRLGVERNVIQKTL